jgi:hypothetical protein
MYIKCIYIPKKLIPYQHVIIGKSYICVGIEYGGYRVVNENNEPILYPKKWFQRIRNYPINWTRTNYSDGQYYIYPAELQENYFFEKWFDGDPMILQQFKDYINSHIHIEKNLEKKKKTGDAVNRPTGIS